MVSCSMVPQSSPSNCLCVISYHILDEGVHQPLVNIRGLVSGVGERDHLGCLFAQPNPLFDGLGIIDQQLRTHQRFALMASSKWKSLVNGGSPHRRLSMREACLC